MLTSGKCADIEPIGDDEYLRGFAHRTTMLLGEAGVARLRGKTVAIAGCGGVGGASAITLARLGVGGFVLADPGIFDPPDANRQWAAARTTLGRNKAEVHAELLRAIHPAIRLTVFTEGITEHNLDAFLAPADVLIDCLDISVPLSLRGRVYRTAMARGLHAVSAPIFGFGTMVLWAEPGGMGMDELIDGFVRVASTESRLPPGVPDHFFGPHVAAIEREIHKHRVPTSGIAVTLAAGLVSSDVARIFLADEQPGLPEPVVLPQVLVVEPWRRTFRVVHHRELFHPRPTRAEREAAFAAAGRDLSRVAAESVAVDLMSDSWHDRWLPPDLHPPMPASRLDGLLSELLGFPHVLPVGRGRLAEALLAPAVVVPGRAVATVAPFPTTRFHVEAAGGRILDVGHPGRPGALDLDALDRALEAGEVGAVWLEAANNALGGQPLGLEVLRAVRERTARAGVPLVLDAARVWTEAALLRARDPSAAARSVEELARELLACADAVAMSLTKELRVPLGGVVATRDPRLLQAVMERAVMAGDGLDPEGRARLAGAVGSAVERGIGAAERVAAAGALAAALLDAGAPVVRPIGGHGVWLDAARALPHVPADQLPERALADALYLEGGVRVAPNIGGPPETSWVRCAVAVGSDPRHAEALVAAWREVLARRSEVRGVRRTGGPGGLLGAFVGEFAPVEAA